PDEIATAVMKRLQPLPAASGGGGALSFDERVTRRAAEILPKLTPLATEGERIFGEIIGDPKQIENFPRHQQRIEEWRHRVGTTYDTELPDSGARLLALPKRGAVGLGPVGYELTRLSQAVEGQKAVIQDLEKYVKRSLTASQK